MAVDDQSYSFVVTVLCIVFKMSSSSDEEALVLYRQLRKRRGRRRYWVHPYIETNIQCRLFVAAAALQETDVKFQSMYRMSKSTYEELSQLVCPFLEKRNTNMRECVSPDERLLITLR